MKKSLIALSVMLVVIACNDNKSGNNVGAGGSDSSSIPHPDPAFKGTVAPTIEGATANFPLPLQAPEGAPNVLIILLDDVGFGQTSTFGGPVATPTLERLAQNGLRYNRFHTTALCSPTRAALLSGRNHH